MRGEKYGCQTSNVKVYTRIEINFVNV